MSGERVTADRALYIHALADAIDWESTFVESHFTDGNGFTVHPHCRPGAPCDAARAAMELLASYRRAYSHVTSRRRRGQSG